MDETQDLLRAIMGRLEELIAEVKGLRLQQEEISAEVKGLRQLQQETNERLTRVEDALVRQENHMDHLVEKWVETDREIFNLKRK